MFCEHVDNWAGTVRSPKRRPMKINGMSNTYKDLLAFSNAPNSSETQTFKPFAMKKTTIDNQTHHTKGYEGKNTQKHLQKTEAAEDLSLASKMLGSCREMDFLDRETWGLRSIDLDVNLLRCGAALEMRQMVVSRARQRVKYKWLYIYFPG